MQLGKVVGRATATIKHETLAGLKLSLVQLLDASGGADGDPQLAVDNVGSRRGDTVMLTSDGSAAREILKKSNTPVRWAVIGICD